MANKIQFKRGVLANLPTLSAGEPAFTTDTNQFYIGNGTSNIEFAKQSSLDNLTNKNKLSQKNILYDITSNSNEYDPALNNAFTNASFYVWHNGDSYIIPYHTDSNGGVTVCGNWVVKTLTASCTSSKLNSINGGINLAMTFDSSLLSWVYLRQLIPVVTAFSKKTYTFVADVEVDVEVDVDLYINARISESDATRINVVDTENLTLSIGRHKIACTFTVSDLDSQLSNVTIMNGLETALRFNGINKTVNAKIYECILVEGDVVKTNSYVNPAKDFQDVSFFYESGEYQLGGLYNSSGQKAVTVPFKSHKFRQPTVTLFDVAGNSGKVSTYDLGGTRTDNVAYTAVSVNQDKFAVYLNNSVASGIRFTYTANSYFV